MQHLVKITVIGAARKILYSYLHSTPEGGDLFQLCRLFGDQTPDCVAVKVQDHHAKLHIHLLSVADPRPLEIATALAAKYPSLRIVIYYEDASVYGTIYAQEGAVYRHVRRTTDRSDQSKA